MFHWYLIRTKQCGETVAQQNLERQGYRLYCPRLLQTKLRRARWTDVVVALFPRYLFLWLREGEQSLSPVRSTSGVADVVRFGARYAVVPDQIISDLQARADPETGLHRLRSLPLFVSGSQVRVVQGPLSGLEGIFERNAGSERVILLLGLLGRSTEVRVPAGFVVPAVAL